MRKFHLIGVPGRILLLFPGLGPLPGYLEEWLLLLVKQLPGQETMSGWLSVLH